ncbi:acyl-CoA dehydrogenase family protein [Methylobacterium oryzisoli]|uniref:acyl-CoA dehydrogenase family protein n=1 Tax=Methylobacterium oryzisoli TaxID=3385502 RepID=UPI003892BB2B
MDAFFTDDERAFRAEIRSAIRAMLPPDLARRTREGIHLTREDMARWNRLLDARGWAAHHWPESAGGPGWTPIQRFIFEAECAAADAPPLSVFGVYLVGPTLHTFGSQAQKDRYLPPIRSGDEFWCQGYSEPEAGSDLASVRTTARKVEGGWIITGQKAWTTEGHFADLMICLARTNRDVRPQAGLSLFIVDMRAPGVTIDPVITIDGGHSVNSVFLDDVRVPDDALIGEVDQGWGYAKFLLNHERTNNAQVHRSRREFERLKQLAARRRGAGGGPVLDDPAFRRRFAVLEADLAGLEATVLRVLIDQTEGREPGPEASIVKVIGSRLQQAISELAMEVIGEDALGVPDAGRDGEVAGWTERHLFRRVVTIYAGSNEIQKTIIARSTLGLR